MALLGATAPAATRLVVTAIERKSGRPVKGLAAQDFVVVDDKTPRQVETAEFTSTAIDVMLLLDTSLAGGMVQPVVENLIGQLEPKEQMAMVSFHSAADLIQDFTASKELLRRAAAGVKYGNAPRLLDALYAAIDGGFQSSTFRRTILLLTAGLEGDSRVREPEVVRLARRHAVSIFPVYVIGYERSLFERLARQTGGASFSLPEMRRADGEGARGSGPGARIFEVLRAHYLLTVSGNLGLGEKLKVEVRRPEKLLVSALPLE